MRCWACCVEPVERFDVTSFGDPEPRYWPNWPPATDHHHAAQPPTPGELAQAGDAAHHAATIAIWDAP